jgi:hypothetical protein
MEKSAFKGRPTEFIYNFDFDENGLLYFLGTNFFTMSWKNPDIVGEVRCFASSLGSGNLHDLVGRSLNNIRTQN